MGIIGTEFIRIEPETGGFAAKLKGMLGANAASAGLAAGVAAGAAVGVGLFAIGEKFDTLYNTVKVKTGATGATFESLKGSVNNVLKGTAGSFSQVGTAVSLLYTRTGLTGGALEKLAKQQVTLARITKTDVAVNVDNATKLFAKYGVAAKDQGKELDVLFKASQQAGVGIDKIMEPMLRSGTTLQQFGFGVDKSAALIASLTKAGVNVQPALNGLRTAFSKIVKEGGDPVKVFEHLQTALTDGKNPALAMKEAMSLLGARGGAELASAIQKGKFSLDGMLHTITNGKGGIAATGDAVSTVGGKFTKLKNMALVAIQPIASAVYDFVNNALGKLLTWLTSSGPKFAGAFDKLRPIIETIKNAFLAVVPVVKQVGDALLNFAKGNIATVLGAIGAALFLIAAPAVVGGITALVGSFIALFTIANLEVVAFIALVAGVIYAYQHFETFRNIIDSVATWLTSVAWPAIQQFAKYIVNEFQALVGAVSSRWNDIRLSIEHVLTAIKVIVAVTLAPIFFIWEHFHQQIMAVVMTVWTLIKAIIQNALQVVQGVIDIVLGVLSGHWSRAWKGIQEVVGGVWNLIVAIVKAAIGIVWQVIQAGLKLAATVVSTGIGLIVGFFQKLPGRILSAIGDATTWLFHVGQQIMAGLVNGITHAGVNIGQAIINQLPGPVQGLVGGLLGVGGSSKDFSQAFGTKSTPQRRTGQARAGGGSVMAGVGYPVGEHGPEWFTPGQSGTIIPNRGAGGSGVTIVLAPTFPPGMDAATALAHMQAFTVETIAKTFEDVAANGRVGSGRNR